MGCPAHILDTNEIDKHFSAMTMSILKLPNECLQAICERLTDVKHLSAVSKTCRRLYAASVLHLFKQDLDPSNPFDEGTAVAWALKWNVPETIHRTTSLGIVAPGHLTMAAAKGEEELFKLLWECMEKSGTLEVNHDGFGNSPFIAAVARFSDVSHSMLATGKVQVDNKNASGDTALIIAAHNGDSDLVEKLLALGANHSTRDNAGCTALSLACQQHICGCECGREPDSNSCEDCKDTGLCDTCEIECGKIHIVPQTDSSQYLRTVQLLVSSGAEVNVTDDHGATPLQHAMTTGNLETVQLLVKHGADVNARNEDNETPLIYNAENMCDLEIAKCLIDNGADVHAVSDHGRSVLCFSPLAKEPVKLAQFLIQQGASVADCDPDAPNPLHYSVEFPEPTLTELFLDLGVDINSRKPYGGTPLATACNSQPSKMAVIKLLVDRGADVTLAGEDDRHTPLAFAIYNNFTPDIIKLLLDNGANPDNMLPCGKRALQQAILHRSFEIAKMLLQYGANPSALDEDKKNCLYYAAQRGDLAMLELLYQHGAVIEHGCGPNDNLLSNAMIWGRSFNAVEWLVQKGVDIHKRDSYGVTILHEATSESDRHVQVMKLLLEHGAKFDVKDEAGKTPLDHISEWCEVVSRKQELFIDCGSGPSLLESSWIAKLTRVSVLLKVIDVLAAYTN